MPSNATPHWRKSSHCATLRDSGLRPTRQRVQIAELLFAKGDRHLTAEALFAEAREQRYPPSLATIYNALRDFAAHGLVREIALYGAKTCTTPRSARTTISIWKTATNSSTFPKNSSR